MLDKLIEICEKNGIQVVEEEYIPSQFDGFEMRLVINSIEKEVIGAEIVVAHELGHYFDMVYRFNGSPEKAGAERMTRQGVLHQEEVAWEYAERILRELGYSDWDNFHEKKEISLKSYEENILPRMFPEQIDVMEQQIDAMEMEKQLWDLVNNLLSED